MGICLRSGETTDVIPSRAQRGRRPWPSNIALNKGITVGEEQILIAVDNNTHIVQSIIRTNSTVYIAHGEILQSSIDHLLNMLNKLRLFSERGLTSCRACAT